MPRVNNLREPCPNRVEPYSHLWEADESGRVGCFLCGAPFQSRWVVPDRLDDDEPVVIVTTSPHYEGTRDSSPDLNRPRKETK